MRFGSRKITGSSSSIEAIKRPLASYGFDGSTVVSPHTCVNRLSGLWLCVWPPWMPPPQGMRTVIGAVNSALERYRKRAASEIS